MSHFAQKISAANGADVWPKKSLRRVLCVSYVMKGCAKFWCDLLTSDHFTVCSLAEWQGLGVIVMLIPDKILVRALSWSLENWSVLWLCVCVCVCVRARARARVISCDLWQRFGVNIKLFCEKKADLYCDKVFFQLGEVNWSVVCAACCYMALVFTFMRLFNILIS